MLFWKFSFLTIAFTISLKVIGQIAFVDIGQQIGLDSERWNMGISVVDFNNDGYDDIFVSRDQSTLRNKLYLNDGGKQFIDVSHLLNDRSSRTVGSIWVDLDNNGWLDLLVINRRNEPKQVYLNYGPAGFENVSFKTGITDLLDTKSANAADFNNDGWIDLYFNNFKADNCLYINNGDGTFTNIIEESGANSLFNAMGAVAFDYDSDGFMDIYLTHDGNPYELFRNLGNLRFENIAPKIGANYRGFGMGVDITDLNQDGIQDIYITNLYENTLLISDNDSNYTNIAKGSGIDDFGMGWGINFLDANNDGRKDIYVVNDYFFMPYINVLYLNQGNLQFTKVENTVLSSPFGGYGSAVADFDHDGKIDIFIANQTHPIQLLKNQSAGGNWIKLKLVDTEKNTHAIGAKVTVKVKDEIQSDFVKAGSSYLSQSSYVLHYGLGNENRIDEIIINWPDNTIQKIENIDANHFYLIEKNDIIRKFESAYFEKLFDASVLLSASPPKQELSIYYDTYTQHLSFQTDASGDVTIQIIDLSGKKFWESPTQSRESSWYVSLPTGIYIVHGWINQTKFQRKIVVQD